MAVHKLGVLSGNWGWGQPSGRAQWTNVITPDRFIGKYWSCDNHLQETCLYHHNATKSIARGR